MRIFVVLLLALIACGKPAEPPAPGAGSGSGSAAMAARTPPVADNAACKLVTRAEAETLVGMELPDVDASTDGMGNQICNYKRSKPYAKVDVTLWSRGQTSLDENLGLKYFGATPVEIAGAGTRALRNDVGSVFGVLANGKFASVFGVTMTPPATTTAATAEALAKTLATRL